MGSITDINAHRNRGRDSRIGRYRMLGLLAKGGMAEIYLALSGELTGFRTLVVVKRILPHLASDTEFIRMFFDEARIVGMMDHPNIVRIIEVGQDGDEYFLAMEVIQGKPLSSLVRKAAKQNTPLTQAQCAYLVAQAANGVGYAHNLVDAGGRPLNVVHRDVSPQNILVSYEGAVKVIDFGVARALGRVSETRPGGLKGKIQYMAPEQAASGRVDRRSDVFALGVVLWEAICGRRPFSRETDLETLRAITQEPIPPPSKFVRISARLEGIVMRALQKSPGDRFQTAQEMALALERYAFASQGFNPVQLAVTMKGLFAGDFARWKRTVAASKELEGEPAEWVNTSGTYLRPQAIDLKTRGSTVALHPAYAPPPALISTQELSSDSRSSDSRSIASSGIGLPRASPAKPRTAFIAGVAALLVLGAAASFAVFLGLSPSTPTMTMVRSAIGGTKRVQVEALPRRALPPDPVPMDPRPHDSPPLPEPSDVPVAASASGSTVEQEGQSIAAAVATPVAAHVDVPVHLPTQRPAARVKKERPGKRKAIAKRVPAPAGARASAAKVTGSENCSLRVGTRPWAEIWIDGKNTYKHTPYLERIPCGNHTLTFKRPDLGLRKTYSIVVGPAGTFKETFSLQEE